MNASLARSRRDTVRKNRKAFVRNKDDLADATLLFRVLPFKFQEDTFRIVEPAAALPCER